MAFNPYDEDERLAMMLACAQKSVQMHFSHLPMQFIIDPPRNLFDAMLARQIVTHILNARFLIPRRRLCKMMGRRRTSTAFACDAIEDRRDIAAFDAAYVTMVERAVKLFERELEIASDYLDSFNQEYEERA
ncbi:conserved hypothetical protein [Roseibium sp. TrichSKD4]|uniref:hypothetical protein n=1 Tax=Roseibium sp. TrichSKD4 TaxID=744980 RepID=UPI0001E57054|nr:hypothetical protein [Roseibium sp. TrichSKD4]EFO31640.1 conserved hypothetical protein [Roseibium sp. TrichSKD4]